jgi:hypothetical protein
MQVTMLISYYRTQGSIEDDPDFKGWPEGQAMVGLEGPVGLTFSSGVFYF